MRKYQVKMENGRNENVDAGESEYKIKEMKWNI